MGGLGLQQVGQDLRRLVLRWMPVVSASSKAPAMP